MLGTGGADVDARGVDAAVSQQIRQLRQIAVQPVERPGEQVAEVVGKHLLVGYPGGTAEGFHLPPDVAAVKGRAAARDEHGAVGDAVLLHVAEQLLLEPGGNEHPAGFALAADDSHAAAGCLGGDGGQLADAYARGADGLEHQRQPRAPRLAGGADEVGVLLGGDLPLLRAVRLVLDPQAVHATFLVTHHAQKTAQRRQNGVDAAGGVVCHKLRLVVQHGVAVQRAVTQPEGEAADVAKVFFQRGGGFLLVSQGGAELGKLCIGDGHGGASKIYYFNGYIIRWRGAVLEWEICRICGEFGGNYRRAPAGGEFFVFG